MSRLFITVFVWFWLTVIAVGVVLAGSVYYNIRSSEARRLALTASIVPYALKEAVDAYESEGDPGVLVAMKIRIGRSAQTAYPIRGFLFQKGGRTVNSVGSTEQLADMTKLAWATKPEQGLVIDGPYATQALTGDKGDDYVLVLAFDQSTLGAKQSFALEAPVIILLASGLFCYFITRHVTSPLLQLRAAARRIAEGRLETRVGPTLGRRRGEIAELGNDFDHMAERIGSLVAGHKRLLGDVSHELRSPLSRLVVALGLVRQGTPEDAPEHLERIALEARRLDLRIGQLLTLSRVDSQSENAPKVRFDVTNLVQEIASDAGFEARARSRTVVVLKAEECAMEGFEDLFRSAVENIVRNAVRYTPENTVVEISLEVTSRAQSKGFLLRVRDHGPGVPEEMLTEIFQPFRRVASSGPGTNDGAGLGLAIAERAVTLHAGTIRAKNAPDGGLIVEVEALCCPP